MISPGDRFKELRVDRDLTQESLAHSAACSVATIRRIERGEEVYRSTMKSVARALDQRSPLSEADIAWFMMQYDITDFVSPRPQEPDPRYSEDERINALVTDIVRLIGEDATSELLESMIKTHSKASAKARKLR